ncbi:MAG: hypothetical protein ABJF23_32925 [Bryobacteraceae bacterium]
MNWMDSVSGLLQQYAGKNVNVADAESHFDQVTNAVPSSSLGSALGDMFRSNDTPPFAQLAGQLFGNSNGAQKSSVLNALLSAAGPNLPSILASAGLGGLASKFASGETVTPEAAEQISPEVIQQVAQHVEQHDPSIVDRLSSIYAEHPTLIKTLGSAVLAVTLAKIANRTQS